MQLLWAYKYTFPNDFEEEHQLLEKSYKEVIKKYKEFMNEYFNTPSRLRLTWADYGSIKIKWGQLQKKAQLVIDCIGKECMKVISRKMIEKVKIKKELYDYENKVIFHAKVCTKEEQEKFHEDRTELALKDYQQEKEHLDNQRKFMEDHIEDCYEYHKNFLQTSNKYGYLHYKNNLDDQGDENDFDNTSWVRLDVKAQKRDFLDDFLDNGLPKIWTLQINNFQSMDDKQVHLLLGNYIKIIFRQSNSKRVRAALTLK